MKKIMPTALYMSLYIAGYVPFRRPIMVRA